MATIEMQGTASDFMKSFKVTVDGRVVIDSGSWWGSSMTETETVVLDSGEHTGACDLWVPAGGATVSCGLNMRLVWSGGKNKHQGS
ncbi:hypothetical protein GWN63_04145 [Candidatus Bathyarchaeota archaeon]|nr:hypothetical protein [Candidatus Bathyarchaeota archaeon]NIU81420.1 hypothetical protein [Candidatus Bathyarchaeota archaeon]NIV68055.1 hypothetical protein [Candidatus Bathyarchaeota archaeon]NIW34584.1 hypothetical protein [Candidatus Bathyarchaeota archaeon]